MVPLFLQRFENKLDGTLIRFPSMLIFTKQGTMEGIFYLLSKKMNRKM